MSEHDAVRITVDGRVLGVNAADTLAAALMNAGVWRFRTSPSGEARAPLCGMGVCFECRVCVDGQDQRRACMLPVREGMLVVTGAARA